MVNTRSQAQSNNEPADISNTLSAPVNRPSIQQPSPSTSGQNAIGVEINETGGASIQNAYTSPSTINESFHTDEYRVARPSIRSKVTYQITKLDGPDNYLAWKFNFRSHIIKLGMKNCFIDNNDDMQPELLAEIGFFCEPTIVRTYLLNCSTGLEAMNLLEKAFGINSANQHKLLTELTQIKSINFNNLNAYIDRSQYLISSLHSVGQIIPDSQVCTYLINGLSDRFKLFKEINIISLNTNNLTSFELCKQIRDLDSNINFQRGMKASFKPKNTQKFKTPKKKPSRPCKHCGGDHWDQDHRESNSKPQNNQNNSSKDKPFIAAMAYHDNKKPESNCQGLKQDSTWLLDTGASIHLSGNLALIKNRKKTHSRIETANGAVISTIKGSVTLYLDNRKVLLKDVHFLPGLKTNLLSGSRFLKAGASLKFTESHATIQFKNEQITIPATNDLTFNITESHALKANSSSRTMEEWHSAFGHINTKAIVSTSRHQPSVVLATTTMPQCTICQLTKFSRRVLPVELPKPTHPLHTISLDIRGPYQESDDGYKYDLKIIDHFSNKSFIYILKRKEEATFSIQQFIKKAMTETSNKLVYLISDGAQEQIGNETKLLAEELGFTIISTTPYTPEQNGKVERLNRTLDEATLCLLEESGAPKTLWPYALLTSNYCRNLSYSKITKNIPNYLWNPSVSLNYSKLQPFGCTAIVSQSLKLGGKPNPRNFRGIFLGYGDDTYDGTTYYGYRILDMKTNLIKYYSSASFIPTEFPYCKKDYKDDLSPYAQETLHQETDDVATNQEIKNGELGGEIEEKNIIHGKRRRKQITFSALLSECLPIDPVTPAEAYKSKNEAEWKMAEKEELKSLYDNETFELVPRSDIVGGANIVKCKFVYKTKLKSDGSIDRFKARLCAKGFTQKEGIDYEETYAPTAKAKSIRTTIAVAAQRNMHILQLDVTAAFLYPKLRQTIYMEQPPNRRENGKEDHVFILKKCIYGLKQSGYEWNQELSNFLKSINFSQCSPTTDECIFRKWIHKELTIITVYVDDMVIASDNQVLLQETIQKLQEKFKIKSEPLSWLLGINITVEDTKISLKQDLYIKSILEKFKINGIYSSKTTPMTKDWINQERNTKRFDNPTHFRSLLGSLMYLAVQTRPDISFAISRIACFAHEPLEQDMEALKRVCLYLKATPELGLVYMKSSNSSTQKLHLERDAVIGFSDSDFAEEKTTRRSTTGSIWIFNGTPISWNSKRQDLVTTSSTEAELVALDFVLKEGIWIRSLLQEIGIIESGPIKILVDNQSTIKIVKGSRITQRTKHIDVKYMFSREMMSSIKLYVEYVESKWNMADGLTKPLPYDGILQLQTLMQGIKIQF